MLRTNIRLLVPTALFVLTGCVPPQPSPQYTGPAPTDPEGAIKAWLSANLKDPDSVKGYEYKGIAKRASDGRWQATVIYNAKNSYGAYTGSGAHYFAFDGDVISAHVSQSEIDELNAKYGH